MFTVLGASNHVPEERAKQDFYTTDPMALEAFYDKFYQDGLTLNRKVWECACGTGALSDVLEYHGHEVYSTDLIDRGFGDKFIDIFDCTEKWSGDILTNPPYNIALDFVKKCLSLIEDGNNVIMFLKIQFLEGKKRYRFFLDNPPKYVYVHSQRQTCFRNNEMNNLNSAVCYAWYVWEKGYKGETTIRWIPPEDINYIKVGDKRTIKD